ncbi:hypothetical protein LWI28_000541 [Acer negundo]|uniref:Uncharacterized protein n=1 Tax=Acer negundo TaxID=4023 RepID=A0AAD5IPK1_ACENE|nr:hypothetical protein LWI28_000541 [Acer negundo]
MERLLLHLFCGVKFTLQAQGIETSSTCHAKISINGTPERGRGVVTQYLAKYCFSERGYKVTEQVPVEINDTGAALLIWEPTVVDGEEACVAMEEVVEIDEANDAMTTLIPRECL